MCKFILLNSGIKTFIINYFGNTSKTTISILQYNIHYILEKNKL